MRTQLFQQLFYNSESLPSFTCCGNRLIKFHHFSCRRWRPTGLIWQVTAKSSPSSTLDVAFVASASAVSSLILFSRHNSVFQVFSCFFGMCFVVNLLDVAVTRVLFWLLFELQFPFDILSLAFICNIPTLHKSRPNAFHSCEGVFPPFLITKITSIVGQNLLCYHSTFVGDQVI